MNSPSWDLDLPPLCPLPWHPLDIKTIEIWTWILCFVLCSDLDQIWIKRFWSWSRSWSRVEVSQRKSRIIHWFLRKISKILTCKLPPLKKKPRIMSVTSFCDVATRGKTLRGLCKQIRCDNFVLLFWSLFFVCGLRMKHCFSIFFFLENCQIHVFVPFSRNYIVCLFFFFFFFKIR